MNIEKDKNYSFYRITVSTEKTVSRIESREGDYIRIYHTPRSYGHDKKTNEYWTVEEYYTIYVYDRNHWSRFSVGIDSLSQIKSTHNDIWLVTDEE